MSIADASTSLSSAVSCFTVALVAAELITAARFPTDLSDTTVPCFAVAGFEVSALMVAISGTAEPLVTVTVTPGVLKTSEVMSVCKELIIALLSPGSYLPGVDL